MIKNQRSIICISGGKHQNLHSLTDFIYHSDDKLAASAVNFIATAQSSAGENAEEKECKGENFVNFKETVQKTAMSLDELFSAYFKLVFFLYFCLTCFCALKSRFHATNPLYSDWFGFVWSRLSAKNLAPTRRSLLQSIIGRQKMLERIDLVGRAITLATTSRNINFGHLKVSRGP